MALGATSISTAAVNTELGSPYGATTSRTIKNLCTHANVNPCSYGRPGYWDIGATADKFIFYQAPRGLTSTDPRGTYNGSDKEVYHLGDFRYYNNSAITPYAGFPSSTIEYGSTTTTANGSITVYVGEMDWAQPGTPAHYHENDWATMTNVHILDSSDDSIVDSATIPASGGNVSLDWSISMPTAGSTYSKTYHVAFGVDATHWSFKMGTDQSLGGVGTVTVKRLSAAAVAGASFDDTSFTGGDNDPYTSCDIIGTENYAIASTDTATFRFTTLDAFRCYYSGGSDDYRSIAATWYVKGFNENPATEYEYKDANIASNDAANTVDLGGTWVDTPPHSTWEDDDNIALILRDLTINF